MALASDAVDVVPEVTTTLPDEVTDVLESAPELEKDA